MKMVMVNNN